MKFSFWPDGLILSLVVFMAGTSAFVFRSFQHRVDLVRPDYYEQDAFVDARSAKIRHSLKKHGKLTATYAAGRLMVKFPDGLSGKTVSGKLTLYDNLNPKNDRIIPFTHLNRALSLELPISLRAGKWKFFIDYSIRGDDYFQEGDFFL